MQSGTGAEYLFPGVTPNPSQQEKALYNKSSTVPLSKDARKSGLTRRHFEA